MAMNPSANDILQIRHLSKTFSGVKALGVKALDNVQLNVRAGEVHALMGENGAGKSTLMKILVGLLAPDSGEIRFEGKDVTGNNVGNGLRTGISMIHQEMMVVPELTVAQNIFLGRETNRGLLSWLDDRRLEKQAEELLAQLNAAIRPDTRMKHLRVAEMQLVEIAKALSNDARLVIMDEPTSALSDKEVAMLFGIIRDLTGKGVAVIYISHKMDEIFAIADTITVLRDGQYITTRPAAELDSRTLITLMVGRSIDSLFPASEVRRGNEVLSVSKLARRGQFQNISFAVHEGEVLGIAGLMGAGRTEIARAIFGLDPIDEGDVFMRGQRVDIRSPREAIRHGIGYVSEDRNGMGFVPRMTVGQNMTLSSLRTYANGLFVDQAREQAAATKMVDDLRVKTSGLDQLLMELSGGNQQKVVIGKMLLASPAVLILDEPTRGVDIGAKAEIYTLIDQLKTSGIAIVMISSELPELLGLSDRILVLANGKQTTILPKKDATQETIMQYAMPH